ncbi:putative ATPase [Nocardia pseudobrasiliensis]|uniref:Putative ATPase n=1 Tax=Nocardia pseudobrasiliensis TaxID=45979 RepID=A0A370IEF3_9NOCA|nr:putative ATPase [Nocardia pseudobrasiliensis]
MGGPRVRALLALLLLEAGRVVGRERLIDGLYGEEPPGDAGHALQSQVSRLRQALRGEGVEVESSAAGYRLVVDAGAVDAHRFERMVGEGREGLRRKDFAAVVALIDAALQLWRGSALADVLDVPFAAAPAARLGEQRCAAIEDRAEAALALGEHQAVVAALSELVAAHPLRERARALLMRGLYAAGRQAAALELFEDGRRLLAEELGADPSPELFEAHQSILRARSTAAPASTRLPAQLTSFVGREDELARLLPLLAGTRLVTVLGPGGTGKTRFALEAGQRLRGEVAFVDLAPLGAQGRVVRAIADALGGRDIATDTASADPEARVLAILAERPMLIILDNCEHVIDDAAAVTHRLLRACPALRVLATSREALRITGETVFPLGQLAIAEPDAPPAAQLSAPAVRLFADRAAAARPGFALDAGTIGTVRRICARLDGLPLAVELAAARLRSLGLDEIDARLDDRFRLLGRGERTAEPRHRTLRAVVEWSWDLLDPAERLLAQRFTVFSGGATPAAVARVCEMDEADELLASLVEKSLVESADGRCRMLETIREFALTRSIEAGEYDRLRHAHARYFTELAERADTHLRGGDQLDWLARLDAERANLQAALHWSAEAAPELALRLTAASAWYWWLTGRTGVAAAVVERLLPLVDPARSPEEFALCVAVATRTGTLADSEIDRATQALAALDRPLLRPHAVFLLAMAGGFLDSDPRFDRTPWSRAFHRLGLGLRLLLSGDPLAAEPEFRAAATDFRGTGDRWATAATLDKLAAIATIRGRHRIALAHMDEAIALAAELGTVDDTADLLNRRGDILTRAGDLPEARASYERAAELARVVGAVDLRANALRGLGDLARVEGDPARARELYDQALSRCPDGTVGAAEARARALIGLGWIARSEQDAAQAFSLHRRAFDVAWTVGHRPIAAAAVVGMSATRTDPEHAALLLGMAEGLSGLRDDGDPDVARISAECEAALGSERFGIARRRGLEIPADRASDLLGE